MKTRVPIFNGHVSSSAKLELAAAEAGLRRKHLETLVGKNVEVIVRKKRAQRSLDQNAYLHAVPFLILAEFFGCSVQETKFAILGEKWGWTKDKITGHDIPVKSSHTSDLDTEDAAELIDWLPAWAMTNFGVDIPLPQKSEQA
jgi:hypothetical protein